MSADALQFNGAHRVALRVSLTITLLAAASYSAEPSTTSATSQPIAPQESLARFQLHPDCRIELVAAEPDVVDPVHIAFDDRARLWVVEYSDYPNGPAAGQPGSSRIRVLTDDDANGRYERPVTFADQLLFATGLLPWRDGVIVTTAGSVLFLRDADGDGRSDESQEWFVGFKEDNPQLRANHPTLAIDNHVYIASGIRGGDVRPGRDWAAAFGRTGDEQPAAVSLGGRDFRFDPLTGDFEAVTGPGQFGLTFDDWGRRFICDNRHPCRQILFEEWDLRLNPPVSVTHTAADVLPAGEASRLYPISRSWTTSNLHANQFTAACGLHIARGDALPEPVRGQPFVCDPTANLVHHARIEPLGATFTARPDGEGVEFLATTDAWFRPVNLTTGPDGALYVVDMYRAVIEHPQFMPEELQNRPDLLLGTDRGRIYRITAKDIHPPPPVRCVTDYSASATAAAIALLRHPNGWHRELGHRQLLQSAAAAVDGELLALAGSDEADARARAQALWLCCRSSGGPDRTSLIRSALKDRDPRLQEQAAALIRAGCSGDVDWTSDLLELLADTTDDRVRFVATISLARWAGQAAASLSGAVCKLNGSHLQDSWLAAATRLAVQDAVAAARQLAENWRSAGAAEVPAEQLRLLEALGEQAGRTNDAATLARLLTDFPRRAGYITEVDQVVVLGVCRGRRQRQPTLKSLLSEQGHHAAAVYVEQAFQQAARDVDANRTAALATAIPLLSYADWDQAYRLLTLAAEHPDQFVRGLALEAVEPRNDEGIDAVLLRNLAGQSPESMRGRLAAIFASPHRLALLLDEIEGGRFPARLLEPARVKQLTTHKDAAIRERAEKLFAALVPAERRGVLAQYQPCLQLSADPGRGREVFKAQCSTCHRIGDVGVDVAPDISDSRVKTREYLLTSILDPNQAIDNNYFSYTLVDVDGLVHTGILTTETGTSVTLKQPEGKTVTLTRDRIEELRSNGVSLMPEGLERNITPQQMADLISFIKNWRYLDGSVPPEVIR